MHPHAKAVGDTFREQEAEQRNEFEYLPAQDQRYRHTGTSVWNELMPGGLDLKELKELIAQAHN
jgi:hypothetical protein